MSTPLSMYHSIALDIAQRIVNEEFPVGSKLSGRSLLAGRYNVSPETIRKAIALLKDSNVVSVSQGKEIVVLSIEQAFNFIEHHKSMQSVYSLKQELENLLIRKHEIDKRLDELLTEIITYSDRLKNLTPYNPIEVRVDPDSHIIGKTIADIQLWQRTGATIVSIRRGNEIIISPGPLACILPNDRIVFVGDSDILKRVTDFINKKA